MDTSARPPTRILIVKLSALGNVVLSLGPFAAIRAYHPNAEITVLTTPPYADWLAKAPWFDHVISDGRPAWWDIGGMLRLRRKLRAGGFDRVYDLQTSGRSSRYFRFFPRAARPEWCGIAAGCSHPHRVPPGTWMHDIDRQYAQLVVAGIADRAPIDLSWSRGDLARFKMPERVALLVPGSSAHRPAKRWPVSHYGELARWLIARGIAPVVVGTRGEVPLGVAIQTMAPEAIDLTGQTTLEELTELTRVAVVTIGNDTGPAHLAAAAGCATVVLFSGDSDPALCAPRGRWVRTLREGDLSALPLSAVTEALPALI